jgi:Family of unknown function (DUF5715)
MNTITGRSVLFVLPITLLWGAVPSPPKEWPHQTVLLPPSRMETPNWVPDTVSLKGGELTKPKQAFDYAKTIKLQFVHSDKELETLVRAGTLVDISSPYIKLVDVSDHYALPVTSDFVRRLAKQYNTAGCGALVVTSAVRQTKNQPKNASPWSVHPTGMSIDFRIPKDTRCRTWLDDSLRKIEATKRIDATREHYHAHYHVVVIKETYENHLKVLMADIAMRKRARQS